MSNLIGKSVLVELEIDSFLGTVIDQNNKRGTVTVISQNDECLEVFIDQVTIDESEAA